VKYLYLAFYRRVRQRTDITAIGNLLLPVGPRSRGVLRVDFDVTNERFTDRMLPSPSGTIAKIAIAGV